MLTPPEFSAQM